MKRAYIRASQKEDPGPRPVQDRDTPEPTPSGHRHELHALQRTLGNRAVGRLLRAGVIQAKLKIGQPDDRYEREADAAARAVTSMQPGTSSRTKPISFPDHGHTLAQSPTAAPTRIQRLVAESEFFVHGHFIQIDYDNNQVSDDQIRQLLRTLELLPPDHLSHIPTITVGNRPPKGGGGAAHSSMPGGPCIRINKNSFGSSWNRGAYNETLLHEAGHIVDWAYGCMRHMGRENPAGYKALLSDPHAGRTQGVSEHFADAYVDYYLGRAMSAARRRALLTSRAYSR